MQKIQIIATPSILGLRPTGVERLPDALISTGLLDNLKSVEPPIEIPALNSQYNYQRDEKTQCLNPKQIHHFSRVLKSHIEDQIDQSHFPLVLGGDCSILIGIMPALKSKGNYGLIFMDGHADFYEPEKSPTGEVADMDLAIVTGRGPDLLTNIDNLKPYVDDENVIQIGQRDGEETKKYGSQNIRKTKVKIFDFETITSKGVDDIVKDVIAHMDMLPVDGFWIHFDTDVINDEQNPAVDYRLPGGITFNEAEKLLTRLMATGKIAGMSVSIFNPVLDQSGEIAVKLSDCIARSLVGGLRSKLG